MTKNFFSLSEKGQVKSVKELSEILKALLRQLKNDKTITRSSAEQKFPIVISQNKLHKKNDRFKILCQEEVDKLVKKQQQSFEKINLMKIQN